MYKGFVVIGNMFGENNFFNAVTSRYLSKKRMSLMKLKHAEMSARVDLLITERNLVKRETIDENLRKI